jgi:hypothetical protein
MNLKTMGEWLLKTARPYCYSLFFLATSCLSNGVCSQGILHGLHGRSSSGFSSSDGICHVGSSIDFSDRVILEGVCNKRSTLFSSFVGAGVQADDAKEKAGGENQCFFHFTEQQYELIFRKVKAIVRFHRYKVIGEFVFRLAALDALITLTTLADLSQPMPSIAQIWGVAS